MNCPPSSSPQDASASSTSADEPASLDLIKEHATREASALEDDAASTNDAFAARIAEATQLLEGLIADRRSLATVDRAARTRFLTAALQVALPDRNERRRLSRELRRLEAEERRNRDKRVLAETGVRRQLDPRRVTHPPSPDVQWLLPTGVVGESPDVDGDWKTVDRPRTCYVCKADFTSVHPFYDSLCPSCSELNWAKRHQTCDLSGRSAVVTGSRVKIGYQAVLKLLRAGCHVIATTRFPRDAAARYAQESDFGEWSDRLEIHGLDLRHVPSVEAFTQHVLQTRSTLDFIVNNACQTVRRPVAFYQHLLEHERRAAAELSPEARRLVQAHEALRPALPEQAGSSSATALAQAQPAWKDAVELSQVRLCADDDIEGGEVFPEGHLDGDLQQIDLRGRNSWRLTLDEVSTVELLEVQLVNSIAPYLLNGRLRPLLKRGSSGDRHVVNVSAMEGQFYRALKTDKHPHTNMAKAALNMMTRTSAADYARDGIHMNSVDTGWITDEDPQTISSRKREEMDFHPPLDVIDAAARILDPIFAGFLTGEHAWGKFFKDYRVTHW